MTHYLRTEQLEILGFTAEYRLLFLLTVALIIITLFIVPCIRFLVHRKYYNLLGFMLMGGALTITLLLYEKHIGMVNMYGTWVKVMAVYSLIYAALLIGKAMRKQNT